MLNYVLTVYNEDVFSQAKTVRILPWRVIYDKILLTDGEGHIFYSVGFKIGWCDSIRVAKKSLKLGRRVVLKETTPWSTTSMKSYTKTKLSLVRILFCVSTEKAISKLYMVS